MYNPFVETTAAAPDGELVSQAQGGDREALGRLLTRHQPWVFNIALRMLGRHADAEDATQDILLRAVKSLRTFRGESQFRTWLYRIVANHLLNVKKQKWVASEALCSFADAAVGLGRVPDFDPHDPRTVPVPVEVLVREAGIGCMIGTLLCLDGRQRLVFVLGEVFGVSDEVGGELVEVTPANFRQILSRPRRSLRVPPRQLQPSRFRKHLQMRPKDAGVHPGRVRRSGETAVHRGLLPPSPGSSRRARGGVERCVHETGRQRLSRPSVL